MWGNIGNFSDLAKAAQELQEQAASSMKQAPAFSPPFSGVAGGFFNMDALQQESDKVEGKSKQKYQHAHAHQHGQSPPRTPPKTIKPLQSLTLPSVPVHKPPTNIKGKLKIPPPASSVVVPSSLFETPVPPPKNTRILTSDVEAIQPLSGPCNQNSLQDTSNAQPSLESANTMQEDIVEDGNASPHKQDLAKEESQPSQIAIQDDTPMIPPEEEATSEPKEELVSMELPSESDVLVESVPSPKDTGTVVGSDEAIDQPNESVPETPVTVNETKLPSSPLSLPSIPPSSSFHSESLIPPETQVPETLPRDEHILHAVPSPSIPENIMEQFSSQLQRLEENHQMEQQAMQQQHQQQVNTLMNQIKSIKEEFSKLHGEKNRQKESLMLQLDSLKHELEGTQQMLQDKTKEERKIQDAHLKQLRKMEKEMNQKEEVNENLRRQLEEKEKTIEEVKGELHASRDEYATLKERVMVVAGELKERRVECRTLQSEVDLLKNTNHSLSDKITHLEAQGMDMNKSSKETSAELNTLRGELMDKEKALQEAKDAIAGEVKKGEDALAAYKKKAQQSLSVSNSRTAAAVQAKEEAEMEARAARSAADSAMERAAAAERKGNEALAEAKAYVTEMEQQVAKLDEIKSQLDNATTQLERVRLDASTAQESNEKLCCELQSVQGRYEAEKKSNEDLRKEVFEANNRSSELLEEVDRLRREGQRLKEDLKRKSTELQEGNVTATAGQNGASAVDLVPGKRTVEAEATIAMLQQELLDANQAIRELKETLKATVEEQSRNQPTNHDEKHESSGGMPLFYAMEKQAELTQARNEIARLANLLGDSEASKQEAIDAMENMRHQLQEVQAKLELQCRRSTPQEERVNLEYLKNVILSFLNAKSQLEKKTLLPVIGTVLCLTPQEQQQAMQHLEKDGKLSLDSVTSSMRSLRWS